MNGEPLRWTVPEPATALGRFLDADGWHRLRSSPLAIAAAFVATLCLLSALLAPWLAPHDPFDLATLDLADSRLPPAWHDGGSARYWLGTDDQGRDILSALMYGARISLAVGAASVLLSVLVGVALGLAAGYVGGWLDALVMRVCDVMLSFPALLVALLVDGIGRAVFPQAHEGLAFAVLIAAISLTGWVQYARTVRGATLVERQKDYVLAARLVGVRPLAIMRRHVLPNVMGPVLVLATIQLGTAIITEATLSFLGVGVPPTSPSLGTLIRAGSDFVLSGEWWIALFPGAMLMLIAMSVNLLGDHAAPEVPAAPAPRRRRAGGRAGDAPHAGGPLLEVRDLRVEFPSRRGTLLALDGVSFDIAPGEVLGVVGESGAGKSLTGAAVIGLLPPPGLVAGGRIRLQGERIDDLPERSRRRLRGRRIGAVFQDPMTALDPLYTVGRQLVETIRTHLPLSVAQAREHAIRLLDDTGIPDAAARLDQYPHQFSGGMRQRVVIALALAAGPRLLVADEPTTALDVSVQAQILSLLQRVCREHGTAVMLVTHDMGVVAQACDRVVVMYAGRVVEIGPVRQVIHAPAHPYTAGLMGAIPSMDLERERLLQIDGAMPRLDAMPPGCAFHPRCPRAFERCRVERPPLLDAGATRAACWLHASAPS